MVGTLRDQIVVPLRERYGAPVLDDLDPADAAAVEVAVTSGVWGVRAEHMDRLPNLKAIVMLGRISHESTVRALGQKLSAAPFAHGSRHTIGDLALFDSYHCSRYNTNTGVLTTKMFRSVFHDVRGYLDSL